MSMMSRQTSLLAHHRHLLRLLISNVEASLSLSSSTTGLPYQLSCAASRGFKSQVSIDQIYPESNPDYLRKPDRSLSDILKAGKDASGKELFSGYIPMEQLEITSSRSSGPGGQNVNKVNSKVEVRFHLQSASWIPDWVKPKLAEQAMGKLTKDGFLVIRSDLTRKQMLNQADCMNKLRNLVFAASALPKEPTKEDIQLKQQRIEAAKRNVLREKKMRSQIKQHRSGPENS